MTGAAGIRPSEVIMEQRRQFGANIGRRAKAAGTNWAAAERYCDGVADRLLGRLPGAGTAQVGWGVFAVASVRLVHAADVPISDAKREGGRVRR